METNLNLKEYPRRTRGTVIIDVSNEALKPYDLTHGQNVITCSGNEATIVGISLCKNDCPMPCKTLLWMQNNITGTVTFTNAMSRAELEVCGYEFP